MKQTVKDTLQREQLLARGMRVTVAVSGGADSMALLHLLVQLQDELGITVSAAHFNHGLRGAEAERDEAFVSQWCAGNQIPLTVGHGSARQRAAETGESIEEAARTLRYAFFETLDTRRVATAHTADDNAETVLLHLLRGTGPRGLCGIPPQRGRYIRPLLNITRAQIDSYLSEYGVPHIEDSTNAADDCVRNRIRHRVMPELLRENPQFLTAVSRTTALQRQEDAYLSELARQAADRCRIEDGFDCDALCTLPPVLLRRVLLGELRGLSLENPAACYVDAVLQLIQSDDPSASVDLPQHLQARREYGKLLFSPPVPQDFAPVQVPISGSAELPALDMTVTCTVTNYSNIPNKTLNVIYLKYDMIAQSVTVRPRRSGDTLTFSCGTKTLKKLMIDRKIPASKRAMIPVIELGGEVAAAEGLGVSRAFVPESGQPVLMIELKRR